ncbi:hypothetical protein CR513_49655, partial [Mucuna pruriens]
MAAYIHDDKILIHCFQDSLTGTTLGWYVSLERGSIKTWRDLAEAFLKQYKYNKDMVPDRLAKKEHEGFKEYAQRWRELAAQVQPSITKREMVTMFIDTLSSSYYDKVVGNATSNFTDLVTVDERIELGIRRGRFSQASSSEGLAKKHTTEKKKGKANAVMVGPIFPQGKGASPPYMTRYANLPPTLDHQPKAGIARHERKPRTLNPIPIVVALATRAKARENNSPQALEPPYPRSYDPVPSVTITKEL